jgi:SAM-dependent methyltransferase
MAEVSARIASLSPEKRKALEVLLKESRERSRQALVQPPAAEPRPADDDDEEIRLTDDFSSDPDELKKKWKIFYNRVTRQLNATEFGEFSFFLNYGYVSDGSKEFSTVELPERFINRNSVKLVLELIGDCDLTARRMLDVGCGRGGTVFVAKTFFNPKKLVGVDLSSSAIEFNRRVHRDPRIEFYEGDAEKLQFEDACFDVVTNVESSHSYPCIQAFYSEVFRVLVPGGYFLYTDLFPVQRAEHCTGLLKHIGFVLERSRDITRNVLKSCDEVAPQRVAAFDATNDPHLVSNFLATPGSDVYENMQTGAWTYQIQKLRKPIALGQEPVGPRTQREE